MSGNTGDWWLKDNVASVDLAGWGGHYRHPDDGRWYHPYAGFLEEKSQRARQCEILLAARSTDPVSDWSGFVARVFDAAGIAEISAGDLDDYQLTNAQIAECFRRFPGKLVGLLIRLTGTASDKRNRTTLSYMAHVEAGLRE